jgi:hypothetical protein
LGNKWSDREMMGLAEIVERNNRPTREELETRIGAALFLLEPHADSELLADVCRILKGEEDA